MAVVNGDRLIVKITLISLLVVLLMDIYVDIQPKQTKIPGVTCFVPAHFTGSHSAYVQRYCHKALYATDEDGYSSVYLPNTDNMPIGQNQSVNRVRLSNPFAVQEGNEVDVKYYFISEVIILCLGYLCLWTISNTVIPSRDVLQGIAFKQDDSGTAMSDLGAEEKEQDAHEKQSFWTSSKINHLKFATSFGISSVLYILCKIILTLAWVIVAAKVKNIANAYDHLNQIDDLKNMPDVFMCDFTIRRLGTLQRYTVQCATGFEAPDSPGPNWKGIVLYANTVLCFTLAGANLIHVCLMYVLGTFNVYKYLSKTNLTKVNVCSLVFSDLVLAMNLGKD